MTPHLKSALGRFPPLLVKEVCTYLWEMLDSGTICTSQSPWCNAVVLVQKKDRSLCFCIDFDCLNACTKKDSYPLLRIKEATWKYGQCRPFFMPGSEVQILADQDGCIVKAVHCIYCGLLGLLQVWPYALWVVQHTSHVSEVNAELPLGAEPNTLPDLLWQHNHFLADGGGTASHLTCCLWLI